MTSSLFLILRKIIFDSYFIISNDLIDKIIREVKMGYMCFAFFVSNFYKELTRIIVAVIVTFLS